jgi:hypothetical protein
MFDNAQNTMLVTSSFPQKNNSLPALNAYTVNLCVENLDINFSLMSQIS